MSGRAFLTKLLEPVVDKISLEMADDDDKTVVGELTRRAAAGRVLVLIGKVQILKPRVLKPRAWIAFISLFCGTG